MGDEVWVAARTYSPGAVNTNTFTLKKGVKLYGGFPAVGSPDISERDWASNVTTLDGNNVNFHVVTGGASAASDDTRIDGFTITRGNASGSDSNAHGYGTGKICFLQRKK